MGGGEERKHESGSNMYTYVCIYVYIYMYAHICMYTYIYRYIYICI